MQGSREGDAGAVEIPACRVQGLVCGAVKGKNMDIDSLTVKEIKHIQSLLKGPGEATHPYEVGKNYFIRTVTMYFTGRLTKITDHELVLDEAAWIADTGRFSDAMKTGSFSEVEPFAGRVIVGRGAIIDAQEWSLVLPKTQK